MSKKQINNRLDKLFDNIKEEEQATEKPLAPKKADKLRKPDAKLLSSKSHKRDDKELLSVQVETTDSHATMSLPFRMDTESWGMLEIVDETPQREWNIEEQLLVQQVTDQLALALENARLFQETQSQSEQQTLINEIVSTITGTLDTEENLQFIAGHLQKIASSYSVSSTIPNYQQMTAKITSYHYEGDDLTIQHDSLKLESLGITTAIQESGGPVKVSDIANNPMAAAIKDSFLARKIQSTVVFPLTAGDDLLGLMSIDFEEKEPKITQDEIDFISTILLQASTSIQRANLYQESQRQREELALVNKIVTQVSSTLEMQDDLLYIAKEIANISKALHVGIALLDEEKKNLVLTADFPEAPEDLGLKISLENNLTSEQVLKNLEPLSVPDIQNNPLTVGIKDMMKERGTESLIIFPLLAGNEAIGTVGVDFSDPTATLEKNEIDLIQTILLQVSTSIETSRFFEKTQQSEEEFRSLFAAMDDVIFVVDRETRYLRIAPTNPSGLVQAPEELLGKRMDEILPEETHSLFRDAIQKALESEETVNIEYALDVLGGDERWFYASLSRLGENQVYWVARDITDRKENERLLQRQNEYMAAAAEVGRLVTSTLDLDILFKRAVTLLQEHFGYYHAAIFLIEETGFDAIVKEATGKAGEEMMANKHSLTIGSKSVVGTATGTGKPYIVNNVEEAPLHHINPLLPETKAEAAIPLKIGRRMVGAIDLQATEANAFTKEDIAVLQLLSDQFATAIDNARSYKLAQDAFIEMRELEKLKSQFLANMSHELRTPLNSIIGFSRVILKGIDGPITDLQTQDLTAIYNSGQHLLGLINDILDLSKIEAGKMELTFDEVNIEKLIKSVMSTVMGLVKDKPVRLEDDIEPNLPPVKADSMRVRQVLINFFSNASKFTDEGIIKVTAKRQGGSVRISIIDSGPGISEEDQEKLFQAFSQVDASATRATGGTGLGLSISKQLITMHGGDIGLKSEVGKGSTFYFTLPLFDSLDEEEEPDSIEDKAPELDDLVILAIDDDEKIIRLYQRYLNKQGYRVVPLTDPKKAVERAKELKPYAITLDIMMPGYDGWQVLQDLKSDPETKNYPTIICSIVEDTTKGYALGATDYLLKPIIEDDLLGSLGRINKSGLIHEVLIIDDDSDDLRLLEKLLIESGKYKPIVANSGQEGWKQMLASPPQALVLDLFMPEMDGFKIVDAMQETEQLKNIPVILITGGDISTTQQEKLDSLNHHLLQKGALDPDELLSTLERSLDHLKEPGEQGKE